MGAVEEPSILLRKTAEQYLQTKVSVPAVGQRRNQRASSRQPLPAFDQHVQRIAKVFQNIGAEDEVELPVQCRQPAIEVGGNEINLGRMRDARHIDSRNGESPLRQNFA